MKRISRKNIASYQDNIALFSVEFPTVGVSEADYTTGLYVAYDKSYAKTLMRLYGDDRKPQAIRPMTVKESIEARVISWETLQDAQGYSRSVTMRSKFFKIPIYTSSAVSFFQHQNKLKVMKEFEPLIMLDYKYDKEYLITSYPEIKGREFRVKQIPCDTHLKKEEILKHPVLDYLVDGDTYLLSTYADIVMFLTGVKEISGFFPFIGNAQNVSLPLILHPADLNTASEFSISDLMRETFFLKKVENGGTA